MLHSLLADRFHLKFHLITKKRAGYALVIDKNGPKLTESKNPGPGLGLGKRNLNGRGANMQPSRSAICHSWNPCGRQNQTHRSL